MDMYRAAERSVNTYFVQLALEVGMCDVVKMAEKLGVESSTDGCADRSYDDKPSFTLGTVEVSPLSVAEAYATFASGGIHCDPIILDTITDSSGKALEAPSANCERVISTDVAAAMNSLLSSVMTKGTGSRVATADGRPQAGKTGTIDSNAAVWFVGYTPQVAGAAMISIDNQRSPFVESGRATGRPASRATACRPPECRWRARAAGTPARRSGSRPWSATCSWSPRRPSTRRRLSWWVGVNRTAAASAARSGVRASPVADLAARSS